MEQYRSGHVPMVVNKKRYFKGGDIVALQIVPLEAFFTTLVTDEY